MKITTKLLALLLTLALLVSVPVVAFAEETAADLFSAEILHSITTEEKTGNGLAFLFTANVSGATKDALHVANFDNATATVNGVKYPVVKMGAIMANQAKDIANIDNLTLADVNDHFVLNVEAKKLYEENACSFIVRIIHIHEEVKGFAIAARPYIVLKDGDQEITYYGKSDIATYNQVYYQNNPTETPVWTAGVPELDGKIAVTAASAQHMVYETTNYREAFKVNATLTNTSKANTFSGDYIVCSFKDAEGNVLGTTTLDVDALVPGATKDVEFYAPVGTAAIEATELNLHYITLPAIGSDIDVSKKKNRIRVSATEASFNEDGTIHVALTFKNYTSNWITEETDYIRYRCYDSAGTVIDLDPKTSATYVTLYIGVIDTKKHPEKTFEFDLPANAASAKIISSKIVYWTEWA